MSNLQLNKMNVEWAFTYQTVMHMLVLNYFGLLLCFMLFL